MTSSDSVTKVLFTNTTKLIFGVISIILALIVYYFTSTFVPFYLTLPFIAVGVCLIGLLGEKVKNNKYVGYIFIIFSLFVIYSTIIVIMNPYDVVTNLYMNGVFSTTPGASEISACTTAYTLALLNAVYNLFCSISFRFKTSKDDEYA